MLKITLVCVGKIKEKWLVSGIEEYTKRLSRYCKLKQIVVPDAPDSLPIKQRLAREAEAILAKIPAEAQVWLCDLHAPEISSEQFAELLAEQTVRGVSEICLVIAGSSGFAETIRAQFKRGICLSQLTFTHQMTRLILLEQIYRAFKINAGETYHK